jgi:hypothetical protein
MHIQILNPLEIPEWDDLLLTNESYSFFHTAAWAKVLCESYGYKPLYFTVIDNSKLSALIPVMEVNSLLTGRRGVSLPFTDSCPPIVSNQAHYKKIVQCIANYGKKAGWKYVECRGAQNLLYDATPFSHYYGHILELSENEKQTSANFRDSTKRNIKKAIKEGVEVRIDNSSDSMSEFYRLNCMTRKRHGLPPQPLYFFKNLFDHIISENKGIIVIASCHKRKVACAVFVHVGEKSYFKYGASDTVYHAYRPNNLVLWKAIEFYAGNCFRSFDFGRTKPTNEGLLQYKRGWGTSEEVIKYYKYCLLKNEYIQESSGVNLLSKLLKKTPTHLLKLTGYLFYRHAA